MLQINIETNMLDASRVQQPEAFKTLLELTEKAKYNKLTEQDMCRGQRKHAFAANKDCHEVF